MAMENHNGKRPNRQRRYGAFYTPDDVALILMRWITSRNDGPILDPSFGGCSFLRAGLTALRERAIRRPGRLLFGIDRDRKVRSHARVLSLEGVPADHFLYADFLDVTPPVFGRTAFGAIVGNPPYVRHHWHTIEMRERAAARMSEMGYEISGRASSWAYFILHAIRFLADGGSLAMVLPVAVMKSDYANSVRDILDREFAQTRFLQLRERIFKGTHEQAVVILCSGKHKRGHRSSFQVVGTVQELERAVNANSKHAKQSRGKCSSWVEAVLPDRVLDALVIARASSRVHLLGDLATIRIGVVTGGNEFFVQRPSMAKSFRQDGARLVTILTRSDQLTGGVWCLEDERDLAKLDLPSRLVIVRRAGRQTGTVETMIRKARANGVNLGRHAVTRRHWYILEEFAAPDAFLGYMAARTPRLVTNWTGATCTNAIHRVWWNSSRVPAAAVIAGSMTSLFALESEVHGRSYGGGVLKLEPSEARAVAVPVAAGAGRWRRRVDSMLREGDIRGAREFADRVILQRGLGLRLHQVEALADGAEILRELRNRPKTGMA